MCDTPLRDPKRPTLYFRSQVLTNFVLFINFGDNDQLLRLLVGLLIALLDLTLQLQTQPFRRRIDNALNCVVQLMLILFFILGIVLKLCDTDDGFCSRVVGIDSVYTVSVLMVGVGLIGVMGPFGMVVHQLFYARPVPILRDAHTMEPPKLMLGEGERYHLFLCAHRHKPHTSPVTQPHSERIPCVYWSQESHLEHRTRPVRHHQTPAAAAAPWCHRVP